MADYLALDLNKFENQMLNFIEIYYNLLKKEEDKPLKLMKKEDFDIEWKNQIINLLEEYSKEEYQKWVKIRKDTIKKYLEKATEKNKIKIELYMIMDIAETLYEAYFDKKYMKYPKKTGEHIKKHMSRCIYKELIELRNELSHNENPPLELILRFYEDQYYLIKFMKPNDAKVQLSNYIIKDIKMNIHICLEKLLKNYKSFELNPLQEELNIYEESIKRNEDINFRKKKDLNKILTITNEKKDIITSMFQSVPLKLPKYNFIKEEPQEEKQLNDNNDKSSINNDEEKDIYDNCIINDTHNSISSYNSSLSSSERNSVNENDNNNNISQTMTGNIKSAVDLSKTYRSIEDAQDSI